MSKILYILTIFSTFNIAVASAAAMEIKFMPGSHLSVQAKQLIEKAISSRCSELLNLRPEISEVDSRTYVNGAPEDTFDYYVVSSFNVRYLFDGVHPSTDGMSIAIRETSNDRVTWSPVLESLNFSGNGCN